MGAADLKAWRDRLGLSQSQASACLRIPVRTLQGLELGRSPTSPLWGPLELLTKQIERHISYHQEEQINMVIGDITPPCSRYEGGEDDRRVRDTLMIATGMAKAYISREILFDRIARLYDYKGDLHIITWKPLGSHVETYFRKAWEEVGEISEHVHFHRLHSDSWHGVWASRRYDSDWKPL